MRDIELSDRLPDSLGDHLSARTDGVEADDDGPDDGAGAIDAAGTRLGRLTAVDGSTVRNKGRPLALALGVVTGLGLLVVLVRRRRRSDATDGTEAVEVASTDASDTGSAVDVAVEGGDAGSTSTETASADRTDADGRGRADSPVAPLVGMAALVGIRLFVDWLSEDDAAGE
jgi:hypothetical protein